MKSKHVDRFNHDPDAFEYDADVLQGENPIRTGYGELLKWIAENANARSCNRLLDLGIGTGNLSFLITANETIGVDTSSKMLSIAKKKLGSRSVKLVQADLLEYFNSKPEPFDCVVSSYAIHHLETEERALLFKFVREFLSPSGIALFGDLMFQNSSEKEKLLTSYKKAGHTNLVSDIEDEFFWNIEEDSKSLKHCGFTLETKRFSDLSWGIKAKH